MEGTNVVTARATPGESKDLPEPEQRAGCVDESVHQGMSSGARLGVLGRKEPGLTTNGEAYPPQGAPLAEAWKQQCCSSFQMNDKYPERYLSPAKGRRMCSLVQ